MGTVIAVASGKGGTGKTSFCANIAISLCALGEKVLVAQASYQHGGTWDGTVKNLRFHWSDVFCFDDGSPAAQLLCQMGANPVTQEQLSDLKALAGAEDNFLGR